LEKRTTSVALSVEGVRARNKWLGLEEGKGGGPEERLGWSRKKKQAMER
jgi:hypothetical protein